MLKLSLLPITHAINITMCLFLSLSCVGNSLKHDCNIIGSSFPEFKLPQTVIISLETSEASREILMNETNIIHVWSKEDNLSLQQQKTLAIMDVLGGNIIGINTDKNLQIENDNIKKLPYKVNLSDKKGELAVKLGVKNTPATFLTDKKGIIRYQIFNNLSGDCWLEEIETAYKRLCLEPHKK